MVCRSSEATLDNGSSAFADVVARRPPSIVRGVARGRPRAALGAREHPLTAATESRILDEVWRMARQLHMRADEPPFCEIVTRASESLSTIAAHLCRGRIDPSCPLRLCHGQRPAPPTARTVRLGVFPLTANPIHWGHLLVMLEAMATLALDRIAVVVQGVDQRKPLASAQTEPDRHALARRALTVIEPLATYSDVGWGNDSLGEQNVFRLLRWNPEVPIVVYYLVGSDHYRLTDDRGRPDTLLRLAANLGDPDSAFVPERHQLQVVFVERGMRGAEVPTDLPVHFIRETLRGSSTDVRAGQLALVPHVVYRYLARHPDYAAAIGLAAAHAAASGSARSSTVRPAAPSHRRWHETAQLTARWPDQPGVSLDGGP